ncbi:MAG: pyridoxamine 5'-phosphate oxidase family protein [SAR324 cluster bacterium]|nr:pyridoxamine 5'-phosphate oxidase family protein [SAR324 cluster bacterium]MCH8885073.1 pyridoxamine 5'-phosphate oxidase family protein [SAR324 cluster bacterium]
MGIALNQAEIDQYMLSSPRGILCVSRENQAPLALPMWFGWIDGKVMMNTLLTSKKVEPIRRNPQVSFLVESGEAYFTLKALLVIGTCEIIENQDGAENWMRRLQQNKPLYQALIPATWPPHLEQHYAKPHAALVITPSSITSWDFGKVRR